jgi:hypothetical protein
MLNFKSYLTEAEEAPEQQPAAPQGQPLMHLRHLEDNALYDGHEGVSRAASFLDDAHAHLTGKSTDTHFSTKYDGSPSIVFGIHPQTKKFFVATKSAFNKEPKINYTPEDIDANHGHAPGLVEKLKAALQHLPKIMPRTAKPGDVYQGDMMYTRPDVQTSGGMHSFTPNTITYSAPEESANGAAVRNSKMGVVVHTQYKGPRGAGVEQMAAGPLPDKEREKFADHPDVNNIDPTINVNAANYTPAEQAEFLAHREMARQTYAKMKPEAFDAVSKHGQLLEQHVNDQIRQGGDPSFDGYMKFLTAKHQKELDKLKTPAARDKKTQQQAQLMQEAMDNKEHFEKALELHGHLQRAKDVLAGVMAKNSDWTHSIGGEATDPEGVVAANKAGEMTKFVNRKEFARQNFLKGKMMQMQKAKAAADA